MHRLLPIGAKSGWWSPRLSPLLVRLCRPVRRLIQRRQYRIDAIEIRGIERLERLLDEACGVLVASNHVTFPDPLVLAEAADRVSRPFYYMTAWQVFGTSSWMKRALLRRLGCFSVDREGTDLRSFRTAVEILGSQQHPLVIFPEGEMYHTNDRVMPFHEGAAAILLSAAKKVDRPVTCLPCAVRYEYVEDPTDELLELMDQLEQRFLWRPDPSLSLVDRIFRLAEAGLALKEIEQLGHTYSGTVPQRLRGLCHAVLSRLEQQCGLQHDDRTVPQRAKLLRQHAIRRLSEFADHDTQRQSMLHVLDDVFLAVQLFSYPGDYLSEMPNIERIAETLDKLEEDILSTPHATVRGHRRVRLAFGEPLPIESKRENQPSVGELTQILETRVQDLLDELVHGVAEETQSSGVLHEDKRATTESQSC